MGHHARGGRLAVGAGDRGDGDARLRALREEHVHHLAGDIAGLALGGGDMHAKAWCCVHLDDGATDILVA